MAGVGLSSFNRNFTIPDFHVAYLLLRVIHDVKRTLRHQCRQYKEGKQNSAESKSCTFSVAECSRGMLTVRNILHFGNSRLSTFRC